MLVIFQVLGWKRAETVGTEGTGRFLERDELVEVWESVLLAVLVCDEQQYWQLNDKNIQDVVYYAKAEGGPQSPV